MYSPAFRNLLFRHSKSLQNSFIRAQSCSIHSIARNPTQAISGETPVPVYTSPEFDQLNQISRSSEGFSSAIMTSPHKAKFFSLIPFHIESKIT